MKKTLFNKEARNKLSEGATELCNAVQVTLGPKGRNAVYFDHYGKPHVTKDGIAVASQLDDLGCEFKNLGVHILRQASAKTADEAGDGTTTTAILATAMLRGGIKLLNDGYDAVDLKKEMEKTKKDILSKLLSLEECCSSLEKIKHVATISANNDVFLGDMIADAFEKVGSEGVVTVEDSPNEKTFLEVTEGMQFDRGYLSPYFCNQGTKCEYKNCAILVTDKKITTASEIADILAKVAEKGQSLLIIAPDYEDEIIQRVAITNKKGMIKACCIKAPGTGDIRREYLRDICASTGAVLLSEDLDIDLKDTELSDLGKCESVKVTKNDTILVGGHSEDSEIEDRVESIKQTLERAVSPYDKEKLNERLAKLVGGIAVIRAGAVTDVELIEKKARIEDAIHATRVAIDEGIVPGGGVALAQIANKLTGCETVLQACKAPLYQLLLNAGQTDLFEEILDLKYGEGYNINNGEKGNLIEMGIIDPVKVTKNCLINAVSVSSMLLTTEVAIIEENKS